MADPVKALLRAADATAAEADTLSEAFARQLAAVLRELERQLVPLVHDVAAGKRPALVKAGQVNQIRVELRAALERAGFATLADTAYGENLDRIVDRVLAARRLAKASAVLARGVPQKIAALKELGTVDLLEEGDQVARELWQAVTRGVFGGRSRDAILQDLYGILDDTEAHIRTFYDTSVSIFGRQVEAMQAGPDPEKVFAYVGPNDEVTRPFCRKHVGKVYTRAQIDQLDNGQLPDVFMTGGGYNCRHVWQEVSAFSELQQLAGTGQRIPEVEAQRALPPAPAEASTVSEAVARRAAQLRTQASTDAERKYAEALAQADIENQQAMAFGDSLTTYTDPATGELVAERQALHEQLLRELVNKPGIVSHPEGEQPVAIFMGGLPGSGKTTAVGKDLDLSTKVLINADEVKALLPEYSGSNAGYLHEESSKVADLAIEYAKAQRKDIVLDATMRTTKSTLARIDDLQNAGYRVEVRFVDVDIVDSVTRSIERFARGREKGVGRYVNVEYIKSQYDPRWGTQPRATFEFVKDHVDAYRIVDNRGKAPSVIAEKGKLTK